MIQNNKKRAYQKPMMKVFLLNTRSHLLQGSLPLGAPPGGNPNQW